MAKGPAKNAKDLLDKMNPDRRSFKKKAKRGLLNTGKKFKEDRKQKRTQRRKQRKKIRKARRAGRIAGEKARAKKRAKNREPQTGFEVLFGTPDKKRKKKKDEFGITMDDLLFGGG